MNDYHFTAFALLCQVTSAFKSAGKSRYLKLVSSSNAIGFAPVEKVGLSALHKAVEDLDLSEFGQNKPFRF